MINVLNTIQRNWDAILEQMVQENEISDVAYTTWIKYFRPCEMKEHILYVLVDKEHLIVSAQWFAKKFRMPLIIAIAEVIDREVDVRFTVPCEKNIYEVQRIRSYDLSE